MIQTAAVAISRSISHKETVHVELSAEERALLEQASDGSTECYREFWGTALDGNEWRVHVRTAGEGS